jgi:hypothetical protein
MPAPVTFSTARRTALSSRRRSPCPGPRPPIWRIGIRRGASPYAAAVAIFEVLYPIGDTCPNAHPAGHFNAGLVCQKQEIAHCPLI